MSPREQRQAKIAGLLAGVTPDHFPLSLQHEMVMEALRTRLFDTEATREYSLLEEPTAEEELNRLLQPGATWKRPRKGS